jgi:hypothetical protein
MSDGPAAFEKKIDDAISAWDELAAAKSFGGMTLAQFKTAVKPSQDARDAIDALNTQMIAAVNARDKADEASATALDLVVKGVVGHPTEGEDSDLYEALGYVRKSERKSGLTRKKQASPAPATPQK